MPEIELLHLYLSPNHNFIGHHGMAPGEHPMIEMNELECVEGSGIRGDRFFDSKPNYKGQITFFADEIYRRLGTALGVQDKAPSVFRRNVITRGVDLNSLIGTEFVIQGVRFQGTQECSPCDWMDYAFGPGAKAALEGNGGLRARVLSSGFLRLQASNPPVK